MGTVTLYPVDSGDDGRWSSEGLGTTNTDNIVGYMSFGGDWTSFFRLPSCPIPQGHVVVSAIPKVYADSSSASQPYSMNLAFAAADNAYAPSSLEEAVALVKTTPTPWIDSAAWSSGVQYTLPNVSSSLQEVIDRDGYAAGNAVMFIISNNGSTAERRISSIRAGVALKFVLEVEWAAPSVPTMYGSGSLLTPLVPMTWPSAIVGTGFLFPPSAIVGTAVQALAGTGRLLAPGSILGVTVPAMAGFGGVPTPSARWSVSADQLPTCETIYTLTLSGDADGLDDITIPMASFQSRLTGDGVHYLSAVVPDSRTWADPIAARANGQWIVKKGLRRSEYALRLALERYEAAAQVEAAAFRASTLGVWLASMAAQADMGSVAGLLSQYLVPAYWVGADRVTPVIKYILGGNPTNSAFIGWFLNEGYASTTDFDWSEAVGLLQDTDWLTSATGGYYTSWRQLCGLDGGDAYVSPDILPLTDAKNAMLADFAAIQSSPDDWMGGGTALAEIVRVDFSGLSWERGSTGDTATITGQSTVAVVATKTVAVTGIQYETMDASAKRRLRCDVSLWLAPGDVATWDDGEMIVGEITHIVGDATAYMEITER